MPPKLLLGTNNPNKVREYRSIFAGIPLELLNLAEAGITTDVAEDGATLEENARLKAGTYASLSGMLALGDDSGLEVDALNGEPGVRSRRYAGENASDEVRNEFLLSKLAGLSSEKRIARFRCVIAIAGPGLKTALCEGICPGVIAESPAGTHGFGYDPVFYLPDLAKTMAELTPDEKNALSHRARAAAKARGLLISIAGV